MARPRVIPKSKMELLKQHMASLLSSMNNSKALDHIESNYWAVWQIVNYWCASGLCKTQTMFFYESIQRARAIYIEALRTRANEIERDMLQASTPTPKGMKINEI